MTFQQAALASALLMLLVVGCAASDPRPTGDGDRVTARPIPTDGPGTWAVLFDGAATDAWRAYGQPAFPTSGWRVSDGVLESLPGDGPDLVSVGTYHDFELEFEWRVAPGGNSGVLYRVLEGPDPSWTSGPEYQVLDDAGHPDGATPATSAGALYGLVEPGPEKRLAAVGEFNSARIVVAAGRVEHWLNGALVVAYDWRSEDIEDRIGASKFRDLAGFMRADAGPIVLQHHGQLAGFRAVRIRPLPGT